MRTVEKILNQHRDHQLLIKAANAAEKPEVRKQLLKKAAIFAVPTQTVLTCINLQRGGFVVTNAVDEDAHAIDGAVIEEHCIYSRTAPIGPSVYMLLRKTFPKADTVHVHGEVKESTPLNTRGEWVTRAWTIRLKTTPPPSPVKNRDRRSKSMSPRKATTGVRTPTVAGKSAKRQISCSQ